MLNLFKSKKTEPSPQDVQNDAFRMQISQLNKALDMYRQTIDNHWAAITKLNKTPPASASYELTIMEKIQKLETAVKTPPSTSKVRKLFADLSDLVARVCNLEEKKDKTATENSSKFNDFLKKYSNGIENHAMHINSLLSSMDDMRKEVQRIKVLDSAIGSLRGYAQRHDGHIGYMTKRLNDLEIAAKNKPLSDKDKAELLMKSLDELPDPFLKTEEELAEEMAEQKRIKRSEYMREYHKRQKVKEATRKYSREWYLKNKDAILARKRAQREADKEPKNAIL